MKIRATLRWQLQLYYFLILLVTLAILTGLSIHWMQRSEQFVHDSRLRDLQRILIPVLTGLHQVDPSLMSKVPPSRSIRRPPPPGESPPPYRRGGAADRQGAPPQRRGGLPDRRGPPDRLGPPDWLEEPPERRGGPPGGGWGPPTRASRSDGLRELIRKGWYFAAWNRFGELEAASRNFPGSIDPNEFPRDLREAQIRNHNGYRQLISRTPRERILIAYPQSILDADVQRRAWLISGISLALLVVSTSVGWWLIGRVLRPLKDIEETANDIAKGQLDRRIQVAPSSSNEISELSDNLNQTFQQFEVMFERQARFTSDASHELRTPIAVILNHCQYGLAKERTSDEYRDALKACQRAGERMKNLTLGLLEISKLESGEIHLEMSDCSLGEIAEEAVELIEPLALEKGIKLRSEIQDVTIRANGDRLWQVLVNLLNNAIRHTPGGKAVTLRTEVAGKQVKIAVIDQGEGISEEAIPHLFERFYRVDTSRSRAQKGSGFGLGLAICETIVKAHRGTIQVKSQPGIETRFDICLPRLS